MCMEGDLMIIMFATRVFSAHFFLKPLFDYQFFSPFLTFLLSTFFACLGLVQQPPSEMA